MLYLNMNMNFEQQYTSDIVWNQILMPYDPDTSVVYSFVVSFSAVVKFTLQNSITIFHCSNKAKTKII